MHWFGNTGEGKADTSELSGGEPERVQTTKSSEYTVSSHGYEDEG